MMSKIFLLTLSETWPKFYPNWWRGQASLVPAAWRAHDALKKVMEKFSIEDIKDFEIVPGISRLTVRQSISS